MSNLQAEHNQPCYVIFNANLNGATVNWDIIGPDEGLLPDSFYKPTQGC